MQSSKKDMPERETTFERELAESSLGKANDMQVGGDHYKKGGEEHWDRAWRLQYDHFQYIITKWIERWKDKGGLVDLRKAQHAIAKYIELVEAGRRIDELRPGNLEDILYRDRLPKCTCGVDGYAQPELWVHTGECPARDQLKNPTPEERKQQMLEIQAKLDYLINEASGGPGRGYVDQ